MIDLFLLQIYSFKLCFHSLSVFYFCSDRVKGEQVHMNDMCIAILNKYDMYLVLSCFDVSLPVSIP